MEREHERGQLRASHADPVRSRERDELEAAEAGGGARNRQREVAGSDEQQNCQRARRRGGSRAQARRT